MLIDLCTSTTSGKMRMKITKTMVWAVLLALFVRHCEASLPLNASMFVSPRMQTPVPQIQGLRDLRRLNDIPPKPIWFELKNQIDQLKVGVTSMKDWNQLYQQKIRQGKESRNRQLQTAGDVCGVFRSLYEISDTSLRDKDTKEVFPGYVVGGFCEIQEYESQLTESAKAIYFIQTRIIPVIDQILQYGVPNDFGVECFGPAFVADVLERVFKLFTPCTRLSNWKGVKFVFDKIDKVLDIAIVIPGVKIVARYLRRGVGYVIEKLDNTIKSSTAACQVIDSKAKRWFKEITEFLEDSREFFEKVFAYLSFSLDVACGGAKFAISTTTQFDPNHANDPQTRRAHRVLENLLTDSGQVKTESQITVSNVTRSRERQLAYISNGIDMSVLEEMERQLLAIASVLNEAGKSMHIVADEIQDVFEAIENVVDPAISTVNGIVSTMEPIVSVLNKITNAIGWLRCPRVSTIFS